jgi:hypothetical protein
MLRLPSSHGEKCRLSCRYDPHATFDTGGKEGGGGGG